MTKDNIEIQQFFLTEEIKKKITEGFTTLAIQHMGYDGQDPNEIAFVANDGYRFVGVISVLHFWEALWIKKLFVDESYRGSGIGKNLVNRALDYGRELNCNFAFAETMSFQSPKFYHKLGFKLEYTRSGFAECTCLHYFKKSFKE